MDDNCGEWVESMGVASGRGLQEVGCVCVCVCVCVYVREVEWESVCGREREGLCRKAVGNVKFVH